MSALPIQYHLEVYEGSFINDSFWSIESATPLPAISIGEQFNHKGLPEVALYNPLKNNQIFRVKDIEHIFWVIENSHIGHKLMVCLEAVNRNEP
jgi:hypothetical protein